MVRREETAGWIEGLVPDFGQYRQRSARQALKFAFDRSAELIYSLRQTAAHVRLLTDDRFRCGGLHDGFLRTRPPSLPEYGMNVN